MRDTHHAINVTKTNNSIAASQKRRGGPRLPYGTGAALLQCAIRSRVIHNAKNLNRLFVLFASNNLWMRAREGRRLGTCKGGMTLPSGLRGAPELLNNAFSHSRMCLRPRDSSFMSYPVSALRGRV